MQWPPIAGSTKRCIPDWGQRFLVTRELARVKSEFQDIVIFESSSHGRVMVLDGVIQITEGDEFVYQEMLTHVPLLAHGAAENVLIIGAGDGGVLRRVLQHGNVKRAVMVEIDGEVIRLSKEFLPKIAGDAWTDPRAEVIVGDGIDYVKRAPDASFDVDHRRFDRSDRCWRGAVHRRFLSQLRPHPDPARAGGEPVRRSVHAGGRTAGHQCAAAEILSSCHGLCRGGSDLCRRIHDAGLGGEGRLAGGNAGGDDPARAEQAGILGTTRVLDAGNPCRGVQPAALYRATSADGVIASTCGITAWPSTGICARSGRRRTADHIGELG